MHQGPLRCIYNKIRNESPTDELPLALRLNLKAMNGTMGPNFLVPSHLIFYISAAFRRLTQFYKAMLTV